LLKYLHLDIFDLFSHRCAVLEVYFHSSGTDVSSLLKDMSGRTTVSAPFAVGGNLAEGVEDVDQRQRARQAQRSDGRAKSLSDALLNDSAVIKARFPDRQDSKKVYTTSMSEMSKAIPKNVEITLYDTFQDEKMGRLAQPPARVEAIAEENRERRERLADKGHRGIVNPALSRLKGGGDHGTPRSGSPGRTSRSSSPATGRYGSPGPGSRGSSPAPGMGSARRGSPAPGSGRNSPAPYR